MFERFFFLLNTNPMFYSSFLRCCCLIGSCKWLWPRRGLFLEVQELNGVGMFSLRVFFCGRERSEREQCGFSRPLRLHNTNQPFPAATARVSERARQSRRQNPHHVEREDVRVTAGEMDVVLANHRGCIHLT